MTLAVGLFDLFTYAIPGALHLAFLAYLAGRLHWLDLAAVSRAPGAVLVIGIVVASYLLGYLAYPMGARAARWLPRRRKRNAREEFLRRNPAASGRAFVEADSFLLLSALQLHDADAAMEATRLRTVGLMLRNSSPPMAFGFVASVVELIAGGHPVFAVCGAVLFAAAYPALIAQGRLMSHWANVKTLELSFWVPEVEETLAAVQKPV
ncbi:MULTISPECIES: hypothetical protein [Amycolatopsis]|uniref:Uncharacterized protein n=1 Tax=Amycolatopsis dendrobii TaxID=2760662 RepID=A0A7W3W779_9PSEU|nr:MULTISPECIES: hypothetical protein [Amycolatopsis]MBB1159592.1 hypothetical protein [Amycolatopsis dendrobii]UKD57325.1 hypothetical protein L3Q65_11565 [Amycolatopsis sp. FU40]